MAVYVSDLFTATPAPVDANPTATRTFQWLRGSTAISGATSSTYTAVTADIGSSLSTTQFETNFLSSVTATSASTETVQAFDPIRLFSSSEPGVWYDPNDAANLAWRRNLLLQTEQFNLSPWSVGDISVTANNTTAPDGTGTADKLVEFATTALHFISQTTTIVAGANTFSVYLKAAERQFAFLYHGLTNTGFSVNLATGATGLPASSVAPVASSVTSVGDGWYRVSMTVTATAGAQFFRVYLSDTLTGGGSYTGNGTSGLFAWGAQVETGSVATEYQPITDLNTEVIARFPNATLYQDVTGAAPVTTPGQTIGLMLDKSRGLVLGPEIITNGDFSNPVTTGWVAQGSTTPATISVVSGELSINTAAGNNFPGAKYDFPTVVGRTYKVSLTARTSISPNGCSVYIRDSGGNYITDQRAIGSTNTVYNFVFVARQTSSNIFIFEFTGSAGTGTIFADNISVKELPGLHATQPTLASRPTYGIVPTGGRRNLLLYSEQFENAAWSRLGISAVMPNVAIAPDGTLTADKVIAAATTAEHSIYQNTSGNTGTVYVVAKAAEYDNLRVGDLGNFWFYASFNLTTGAVSGAAGSRLVSASAVSLGNGWWGCTIKYTESGAVAIALGGFPAGATGFAAPNFTGDGTSGVFIWRTQVEPGSTATAYQKVTTQYDVTEAGVPSLGYLFFDGVNDFMVTPTITPGTDKVQVFTGVRKLSDAALGMLYETSTDAAATAGALHLYHGSDRVLTGRARGSVAGFVSTTAIDSSPYSFVSTLQGDIAGDTLSIRVNSVVRASSTADQGTGNFAAYPMYIGMRAGTQFPFNGNIHSFIARFGSNLTAARIAATETWVATKTAGVTL